MHLLACAGEVLEQCEVCRPFDKAPRVPAAGTSTVPMFDENLQVDLFLVGDIIVLRATDVFSTYSLLMPVSSKDPRGVSDASCSSRTGVSGRPQSIQMDEGDEWKHEVCTGSRPERRTTLQFQFVGAHPWMLSRRNGLARGIYNRSVADDRFSGKQVSAKAHWRLISLISGGGVAACRAIFWSAPADLFSRYDGRDGDLIFPRLPARTTVETTWKQWNSLLNCRKFAQQWKLRMTAQEAALKVAANSE